MAGFRFESVNKSFGAVQAVQNLCLNAEDGDFIVLLGPTGAGKTSTLRLIAGLENVDSGRIFIGDADVTGIGPAVRDVTFVFQQYSLYPHFSVFDNLAFPLRSPLRHFPERYIQEKVTQVATLLQIQDKLQSKATQLSGGQMQRVAIGRALVRSPQVALMDEPLSSLDAKLRADLRIELKRIQSELGTTVLYVTHDQIEAMTLATQIGVLDHGALVQFGTPREIYTNPCSAYVATRLGSPPINLLPRSFFPQLHAPANCQTLGARTENVLVDRVQNGRAIGRVDWIEHLGDVNHLHIELSNQQSGNHHLVVLMETHSPFNVNDLVHVTLVNPLFFDEIGKRIASH